MINKNSNTQVALPDKISLPSSTSDVNHNQTVMETEEQKVLNSSNSSITALVPGGVVTTQNISTVIRPKGNSNSLQFVKIQTPELSKKAVEQIRIADETKISKEKIKEVEEEWQNNLLNWKSKRRQQLSHSVDIHEQADQSLDNNNDCGTRKVKTFAEMIEQRAKSGNRLSFHLQRYASTDGDEDDGDGDGDGDADADGDDDGRAVPTIPTLAQSSLQEAPSISPKIVPKSPPSAAIPPLASITSPRESQPKPNRENSGDVAAIPDIPPMTQTSPQRTPSIPHKILPKSPPSAAIPPLAEVTSPRGLQPKPSREDVADAAANLAIPPMVKTAPQRTPSIPSKFVPKSPPSAAIPDIEPLAQTSPQRTPSIPPKIVPKSHQAAASPPLAGITSPREPRPKPNREDNGDATANTDMPPMAQTSPIRTPSIPPKTVPRFPPAASVSDIPPMMQTSPQRTPNIPPKNVPKSPLSAAIPPLAGITSTQESQPKPKREDKDKTVLSISGKKRCSSCKEELGRGAAAFVVESLSLVYHTNCFRCSVCHMNLSNGFRGVDVRVHAGQLHCQNCYSKDGLSYSRV